MRSNALSTDLQVTGVEEVEAFSLSDEDTAHIMSILRDSIYSDPIMAVLREYSANAWDAHKQTPGCEDRPIKVTLPSAAKPTLVIRDFGMGLSKHDVLRVYTKYGKSTKRDTDEAVGFLGIGCKAGFAYATQFTVTSWHGGMKRIFVASLNETGVGVMQMMHEEPCGDETGIEIKVAVKQEDIWTFQDRARKLFQHFDPLPDINLHLEQPNRLRLNKGFLVPEGGVNWVALMGCVPYRVGLDQLRGHPAESAFLNLSPLGGGLYFKIGEVQLASSREELNYTDKTKDAILRRLEELLDEYTTRALDDLKKGTSSWFDRRLQMRFLKQQLRYEGSKEFQSLGADEVPLGGKGFRVYNPNQNRYSKSIAIGGTAQLYLRDDPRSLKGYLLGYYDRIIECTSNEDFKDFEARVMNALEEAKLTGIPIRRLSTAPWFIKRATNLSFYGEGNPKHKVTAFELKADRSYHEHPFSESWEIVNRTPEDSDIFVLINAFQVTGGDYGSDGFYKMYQRDRSLFTALGGRMPTVYGYKTTAKKVVLDADCTGVPYLQWREAYLDSLLTRKVKLLATEYQWSQASRTPFRWHWRNKDWRFYIIDQLPEGHPIANYLLRQVQAQQTVSKADKVLQRSLGHLSEMLQRKKTHPHLKMLRQLEQMYPLLMANDPWGTLSHDKQAKVKLWLDYIALVDRDRETQGQKSMT